MNSHLHVINALQRREATKDFDPSKVIPQPIFDRILEGVRLSPSSFGLQSWQALLIQNPTIRKGLLPLTFGQPQVTEASHYIVFCARQTVDEAYVEEHVQRVGKLRNLPSAAIAEFKQYILRYIAHFPTPAAVTAWSEHQVYIALANAMTLAALENVDACPIEGFLPQKYDEYLGLNGDYRSTVCLAMGYRKEGSASPIKYRKCTDELFQTL